MIYIVDNKDRLDALSEFMPLLSEQRRRKCETYRFQKDKRACVQAELLLRYAVFTEYGKNDIPDIIHMNSRFKPEFITVSKECEDGSSPLILIVLWGN